MKCDRPDHDTPFAAGLGLTIVPVALGVVAPLAGALSDTSPRLSMLAGIGVCVVSAFDLTKLLTGAAGKLPCVMAALAALGAGLGCYIAPNNSAVIGAAPPDKSGVAGEVLNLLRVFGSGLGVAAASAALVWRIEAITGLHERTSNAPENAVLSRAADVFVMVAVFAAIGALMAIVRSKPEEGGRPTARAGPAPTRAI